MFPGFNEGSGHSVFASHGQDYFLINDDGLVDRDRDFPDVFVDRDQDFPDVFVVRDRDFPDVFFDHDLDFPDVFALATAANHGQG